MLYVERAAFAFNPPLGTGGCAGKSSWEANGAHPGYRDGMPKVPVPADVDAFLAEANPAVIATTRAPNDPHSVATWYDWEAGRVLVNMDESRARLRWMTVGSRVSLTVWDKDDWYVHVTVAGRVAELHDDPDLADIDRLSTRYRGQPYYVRDHKRVSAWIDVDSWHSWDARGRRISAT